MPKRQSPIWSEWQILQDGRVQCLFCHNTQLKHSKKCENHTSKCVVRLLKKRKQNRTSIEVKSVDEDIQVIDSAVSSSTSPSPPQKIR